MTFLSQCKNCLQSYQSHHKENKRLIGFARFAGTPFRNLTKFKNIFLAFSIFLNMMQSGQKENKSE
jgi:hypothetical protein